jgi:hypothetical protein
MKMASASRWLAEPTAEIMGPDGSHVSERRKTGDRSADHCLRSDPSAAMTRSRPARHPHRIGHLSLCGGLSAGSKVAPMALRNDRLFQHNQKRREKGNEQ